MSYRSVPRPSSPLSAKASTECPSFTSSLSLSILTSGLAFGQNAESAEHLAKPNAERYSVRTKIQIPRKA